MLKKFLILLILLCCFCCGNNSKIETFLLGRHIVKKTHQWCRKNATIQGGFFVIAGNFDGLSIEQMVVTFTWQLNDGSYTVNTLPIEKIRVKINNTLKIPIISFKIKKYAIEDSETDVQKIMDYAVDYALIECKEQDWPLTI